MDLRTDGAQSERLTLPMGWRRQKLGDLATFAKGAGLAKSVLTPFGRDPCVHYGELFRRHPATIEQVLSRTDAPGSSFSQENDVLMPTSDVTPTGLATASAILMSGVILGGDILVIRCDPEAVYGPFLAHMIRHSIEQIMRLVSGTTVFHIYAEDMKEFEFLVPPVEEQREIVAVLSDSDALISALEQLLHKKRLIKQGAMQALLTGNRRLPGFADEWAPQMLGDLATFAKGAGLPKSALTPFGRRPCVHYGELFRRHPATIEQVLSRTDAPGAFFSQENDVLMPTSDVTPTGLATASAISMSGVILGGDILVIRCAPDAVYGPFLAHLIRQSQAQILQLVSGTTVFHIYAEDMRRFALKLPSIEEQQAIVTVLSDMDAELSALEAQLLKAQQVKLGLMNELLSGRTGQ